MDTSGVVVLPSRMAPASLRRATHGESSLARSLGESAREPRRVGLPSHRSRSFTVAGTPSSSLRGGGGQRELQSSRAGRYPFGWPRFQRSSDCLALLRAPSWSIRQNALSVGLSCDRYVIESVACHDSGSNSGGLQVGGVGGGLPRRCGADRHPRRPQATTCRHGRARASPQRRAGKVMSTTPFAGDRSLLKKQVWWS